jgi:hypothetical protein
MRSHQLLKFSSVSGTARCLRPLPSTRTRPPGPNVTSAPLIVTSSETRSPAWITRIASRGHGGLPALLRWRIDQRLGVLRGEEGHRASFEAFGRGAEPPLDHGRVLGCRAAA